ncbi:hypothetical protein ACN27F_12715 [Solwaraspora sp. WMMB335]|uniref:hypothetical protein n=1 Tax=Solwaraspora sp. WMMB335 TaxID=3404118 RepID=UPI003B93DC0B
MHEPGAVGGGTDWHQFDTEAMWRMLEHHDVERQWRQVAGWQRAYELAATHLTRLRRHRDRLVVIWPPAVGTASAAHIARLDQLIGNVQQTYEVATANQAATRAATAALSAARSALRHLYAEHTRLRQQQAEQLRAAAAPGTRPMRERQIGPLPVTTADLAVVAERARSVMRQLSDTLVQAQVRIRQPPTFAAGGAGSTVPDHDIVSPFEPGRSTPDIGSGSAMVTAATAEVPTGRTAAGVTTGSGRPVATGTTAAMVAAGAAAAVGAARTAGAVGPVDVRRPLVVRSPGDVVPTGMPDAGTTPAAAKSGPVPAPTSGPVPGSASPKGPVGAPSPASPARVNPVGAVIAPPVGPVGSSGSSGAQPAPSPQSAPSPQPAPVPQPGAATGRPGGDRHPTHVAGREPGPRWTVPAVVPGVIRPRAGRRHDPGPVIGPPG